MTSLFENNRLWIICCLYVTFFIFVDLTIKSRWCESTIYMSDIKVTDSCMHMIDI